MKKIFILLCFAFPLLLSSGCSMHFPEYSDIDSDPYYYDNYYDSYTETNRPVINDVYVLGEKNTGSPYERLTIFVDAQHSSSASYQWVSNRENDSYFYEFSPDYGYNTHSGIINFVAKRSGTYIVTCIITDNQHSVSKSIEVTINENT